MQRTLEAVKEGHLVRKQLLVENIQPREGRLWERSIGIPECMCLSYMHNRVKEGIELENDREMS